VFESTSLPDRLGIPLEIPRRDIKYVIRLYGETQYYINGFGETKVPSGMQSMPMILVRFVDLLIY
jgi:hypothetical protein